MKLNNKILICNLVLSIGIFLLSSVGLYYVISYSVYEELDNHLMQHKTDIIKQVQNNPESLKHIQQLGGLGSYEWVDIKAQNKPFRGSANHFETIDTVRNTAKLQPETYRRLTTTISVKNQHYSLEIYEEVASWQNISRTILMSVLAGLLVWILLLYIFNQLVFDRILAPFYDTVDKLETISQPTDFDEHFPTSTTYEINVLNKALNTMMNQIRASFEDQKKFIQNVSHELLTPLSIIRQKTEKMLSESTNQNPQLARKANEILETTIRLGRLSNALLLISRVENKQYECNDTVDIEDAVNSVLGELEDFITLKNITVEREVETTILVQGNRELIESAIYNIIQNAVKFSQNYATISILSHYNNAGQKELRITDDGPGISSDIKNSVFDRFTQDGNGANNKSSYHGTGLGLSLVKSICELHDFGYKAENYRNGTGAVFTIQF